MTIRKSKYEGHLIGQCDQCFDVVDFEDLDGEYAGDWSEARHRLDIDGWRSHKTPEGWRNICCDCVS